MTEILFHRVREDIYKGLSQADLVERIITNHYNLKYEQEYSAHYAKNVISDVRKNIKNEWRDMYKELKETQLARLLDLYRDSRKRNDGTTALNTLKEINKVASIYDAEKLDVNLKGDLYIDFGFDNENFDNENKEDNNEE